MRTQAPSAHAASTAPSRLNRPQWIRVAALTCKEQPARRQGAVSARKAGRGAISPCAPCSHEAERRLAGHLHAAPQHVKKRSGAVWRPILARNGAPRSSCRGARSRVIIALPDRSLPTWRRAKRFGSGRLLLVTGGGSAGCAACEEERSALVQPLAVCVAVDASAGMRRPTLIGIMADAHGTLRRPRASSEYQLDCAPSRALCGFWRGSERVPAGCLVGLCEYPLDSPALRAGSRALCVFSGGLNAFPRVAGWACASIRWTRPRCARARAPFACLAGV